MIGQGRMAAEGRQTEVTNNMASLEKKSTTERFSFLFISRSVGNNIEHVAICLTLIYRTEVFTALNLNALAA